MRISRIRHRQIIACLPLFSRSILRNYRGFPWFLVSLPLASGVQINAGEEHGELSGPEFDCGESRRLAEELKGASLKPLVPDRQPSIFPVQQLDAVTSFVEE